MKPLKIDHESFAILAEASRIGVQTTLNLTPKKHLDFIKVESLLYDESHLPLKFDTMVTLPGYYPDSLIYTNVASYVQVTSNSTEFNIRYIESVLQEIEIQEDIDYDIFKNEDKYQSPNINDEIELGRVFFAPGSNLSQVVNVEKLDEYMNLYDDMLIKPHPLSDDEEIHQLSIKYGYDRIIEKQISAESVLKSCSKVYYCDNSEIGMRAMLMGIPTDHMNNLEVASTLTYFHLYHVLRRTEEEHRAKLVYNFLSNPLFGYFNIDTSEDILSEQIVEFLYRIEDLRSYLKPKIRGYDPNPKKCKCKD